MVVTALQTLFTRHKEQRTRHASRCFVEPGWTYRCFQTLFTRHKEQGTGLRRNKAQSTILCVAKGAVRYGFSVGRSSRAHHGSRSSAVCRMAEHTCFPMVEGRTSSERSWTTLGFSAAVSRRIVPKSRSWVNTTHSCRLAHAMISGSGALAGPIVLQ